MVALPAVVAYNALVALPAVDAYNALVALVALPLKALAVILAPPVNNIELSDVLPAFNTSSKSGVIGGGKLFI